VGEGGVRLRFFFFVERMGAYWRILFTFAVVLRDFVLRVMGTGTCPRPAGVESVFE